MLILPPLLKAQIKAIEGELSVGATVSPEKGKAGGTILAGELRFNMQNSNFSPGFHTSACKIKQISPASYHDYYTDLIIFCDYNFYKDKKISPFIGTGFGMSDIDNDNEDHRHPSGIIYGRIGCSLYKHYRITADYRGHEQHCSYFSFRISYIF